MEKYNAETMAIVPRDLTEFMYADATASNFRNLFEGNKQLWAQDHYTAMLNAAPPTEPVVPLSEVLELLEYELKNMDVEDDFTDGFKSGFSFAHHLIKQKYGVSK